MAESDNILTKLQDLLVYLILRRFCVFQAFENKDPSGSERPF